MSHYYVDMMPDDRADRPAVFVCSAALEKKEVGNMLTKSKKRNIICIITSDTKSSLIRFNR